MAGVASRLSRKELEFMAKDIGPELAPFLNPGDVVKGMNAEKRQGLLAEILDAANMEEVVSKMSPAHKKRLLELALKLVSADLITNTEHDSKSNN
jgi:hypothetical protein